MARQLRALTDAASSPAEHERLNYLTRFVEFLTPYSESWSLAQHLHLKLQQASELKKQNKAEEARQLDPGGRRAPLVATGARSGKSFWTIRKS